MMVHWSDDLEALHEETTRTHFLDVQTRAAVVSALASTIRGGRLVDLGCSSGLLLTEVAVARPDLTLTGVDMIERGLERGRSELPQATFLLADATDLPFEDHSFDAVAAANLMEHLDDDGRGLREISRILRPGGRAAVVVPLGPSLFDFYDETLGHVRRYHRGELGMRARSAGLRPVAARRLGSFVYPAFWAVKKLHRLRPPADPAARVAADIARTQTSRVGSLLAALELRLPASLPFGIRELVVLEPT